MSSQRLILSLMALVVSGAVLAWSMLIPSPTGELAKPVVEIETPPHSAPSGMVWVPSGKFLMGSRDGKDDEKPVHEVELSGYWMDSTEVTNAEFQQFTDATSYVTIAERTPQREDFVGLADTSLIREEDLVPGSICFNPKFDRELVKQLRDGQTDPNWPYAVWMLQKGANWRHPHGPDSNIDDKPTHPAVHIAWPDAIAFCEWSGKRLPTEAEFEYASRGGLQQREYPWGDKLQDGDQWPLNIWQGEFPEEHQVRDGFELTAPTRTFRPNGYGLYDMSGNVWEWCADWYQPKYYSDSPRRDPHGPRDSFDPNEPGLPKRVQRGGSFMCNANYCLGYRCAARMKGEPSSGAFHCGFRCVLAPKDYESFAKAPAQQTATPR